MDIEGMKCTGCGSARVTFDSKRRVLVCFQCGKEEYYSRATLNSNGKVIFSKQNAIRFFSEGKPDSARHYALDVLNIAKDNVPALYIIAYCDEYMAKRDGALKLFFREANSIALEYDEVRDLILLFCASGYNLIDYEFDIITLLAKNMQSNEDIRELSEAIDALCPAFINRRSSGSFLSTEHLEIYRELNEHCDIPKTCFALLKSIQTNPDSPYAANCFHLTARTRYFYEHYVLPIGSVISSMCESQVKPKFLVAYQKARAQFEERMKTKGA